MGSDQGGLTPAERNAPGADARGLRVAYVMSRFPKLTETFVLFEMRALQDLGVEVEVFPLLRERERVQHPESRAFVERAHFRPFFSWPIVRANWHFLCRSPGTYLGTVARVFLRTLPSPNFLAGALAFLPKGVLFAREMREAGVDHVHAHFASHPALVALLVHRLTGIPFSFTAHGSDLHVDQTALGWKLAEAEFAVTVSAYNKEFMRQRLGSVGDRKVRVIHCGIDPALQAREGEPASETFEILCVAALREVKGHRHLIEACRLLCDSGLSFRCHLVGAGELERDLRARIERAGLRERVLLHGALARAPLLARMRDAHVLVLPSVQDRAGRREGIPVTLMEAMGCGLPVVASDLSGIPELVENERSGLLFPPGDPAALAAALSRLHASPELRLRLGRSAREKVTREFDLIEGARRLVREILAAGQRRPAHAGAPRSS